MSKNIQWKQTFSFGVVWLGRYKPLLGWKWRYFWLSSLPLWNISSTIKFRSNWRGNTEKQWLFIESFLATRLLPHYHSLIQTRSQIGGGYRRAVVEKGDLLMWRTLQWPMVMNFIHSINALCVEKRRRKTIWGNTSKPIIWKGSPCPATSVKRLSGPGMQWQCTPIPIIRNDYHICMTIII